MVDLSETPEALVRSAGEATKARVKWAMLLRVLLNTALLGSTVLLNYKTDEAFASPSARFLLSLVVLTYATALVYAIWYRTGRAIVILANVQISSDMMICALLTYATGGILSGFTFLFHLWVIISAVVLGGRASYHFATLASSLLLVLALFMYWGLLAPLSDLVEMVVTAEELAYYLGVNLSALYMVAILVNSLVSRIESADVGLQAEKNRRRDLAQLHSDMIHSLTVGIATTRISGDVLTINPAGAAILGVDERLARGEVLTKWLPDLDNQVEFSTILQARRSGTGIRSDGSDFPVEHIVAPLLSATGMQRGFIVVFSDLTEIRRLETELENSRRLAALGELAASLAHEIRNPLGAVSGSVQMLSGFIDRDEDERALLAIISREITRMSRLVDDMLHYTRPSKKTVERVDLSDLLRGVVQMFELSSEVQERTVTADIEDNLELEADGFQIRQVLWNLLRNASQATGPGDKIEIIGYRREQHCYIEVRDTGVGIKDKDIEKIFDPFYSTRERGIGIGLAVSRRIIEGHQGKISVANRPQGGTVFFIKLPAEARTGVITV